MAYKFYTETNEWREGIYKAEATFMNVNIILSVLLLVLVIAFGILILKAIVKLTKVIVSIPINVVKAIVKCFSKKNK